MFRKITFSLVAITLFVACSPSGNATQTNNSTTAQTATINEVVDKATFAKLLEQDNIQLLDVRTPKEFALGSIDGATNINYFDESFQENLSKIVDPEKTILVYCKAGSRSAQAAKVLAEMGCKTIYDLDGGYDKWK